MTQVRKTIVLLAIVALSACGSKKSLVPKADADEAKKPPIAAVKEAMQTMAGPLVTEPSFELRASGEGTFEPGKAGVVSITLTPRGKYHVNEEFPMRVTLEPAKGFDFAKTTLERSDAASFSTKSARFEIKCTPKESGEQSIRARVSFAVCSDENCIPDERTLALSVPVS